MKLLYLLRKCVSRQYLKKAAWGPAAEIQRLFLEKLSSPQDDWDRSYLQYRCQAFLLGGIWPALMNGAAAILLPIYQLRLCRAKLPLSRSCEAVLLFSGPSNIVPHSLERKYDIVQVKNFQDRLRLNKEDLAYLRKLHRRYPFSFYFRFKCMVKIAMYSDIISRYNPTAIICSEEYSFTSSLLTDYCRQYQIKHINFQHGAKLYFIQDSFFHFDQCYVWDQYTADMLSTMRAYPEQFIIECPPGLRFTAQTTNLEQMDYTYYLQVQTPQELNTIIDNLTILQKRGLKVAIRPHPLHLNVVKSLDKNLDGFTLEDPLSISIEQSLLRTNCAISLFSTALIQAAYNNIPIAIDDLTIPGQYEELNDHQFVCLKMDHKRFSELLANSK